MLCWCLVQHSSAFTRTSHSCWRCERVLSGRDWTFVDLFTVWCQSHHIIAYVVPGHVDVPDVLILLLGWQLEKIFASQGFFSAYSHCHSSQTHTCCRYIQQSFNCICAFCGKEQGISYGACRPPGKVGYDWTWRSNHKWSFPVIYLCFHHYRMVH